MNKNMQLSLKAETFTALQEDFDTILARTITNMETKGAEDATITIKVKVGLEKSSARDYLANGYDGLRDIMKPTFAHEISSVMQIKDKRTGSLSGDFELVFDTQTGKYFMRRVDDGQVQMDGYEDHEDYETVEDEPIGLPAPKEPDPFEYMKQFVGKDVVIGKAYDVITVRTKDGAIILSSGCDESSPFYCDESILEPHIGHEAICSCNRYDDAGGEISEITIECIECQEVLFSIEPAIIDVDTVAPVEEPSAEDGNESETEAPDDLEYDEPDNSEDYEEYDDSEEV